MSRSATVGEVFREQFPALDLDGFTKLGGLVFPGDFTVTVWVGGALYGGANAVTITEIAGSAGEYEVAFTPDTAGYWKIEVIVDLISDIQVIEFDASGAGSGLPSVEVEGLSIGRSTDPLVRVPVGTPYRVSYTVPPTAGAVTVEGKIRQAGQTSWDDLTMVEISVPAGHQRLFEGSYTPIIKGWHYVSISSVSGWDATLTFFAYGVEGAVRTQHTSKSLGA